jgi:hypothetical protein
MVRRSDRKYADAVIEQRHGLRRLSRTLVRLARLHHDPLGTMPTRF